MRRIYECVRINSYIKKSNESIQLKLLYLNGLKIPFVSKKL